MSKYKRGDVLKLNPKDHSSLANWCRHNIFIYDDEYDQFVDTYWGILESNNKRYKLDKLKELGEVVDKKLNIFDMKSCWSRDFEEYEPQDKLYIPVGGGSQRLLVRNGASKSINLKIQLLKDEISELESDISYKQDRVESKKEKLDLLTRDITEPQRVRSSNDDDVKSTK